MINIKNYHKSIVIYINLWYTLIDAYEMEKKMKTLDAIIADKILDLVQYVLLRFIKQDITVDKVTNLDEKRF